ncbi:6152_t:CDS:1, partial [Gigaspora margarita]
IEVDGVGIKAIEISVLPIHIGQRFSVIVDASQDVGSYWIRGVIPIDCLLFGGGTINNNSAIAFNDSNVIKGILRYDGAPNDTPQTNKFNDDWSNNLYPCQDLNISLIKPYVDVEPPQNEKITDRLNISVTINFDDKGTTKAYINGQSW